MMNRELLSFVREQGLIVPGDKITCAVSGGPDSMSMLWALYRLRGELDISLACAHFNHGLRESAAADEDFVRGFCREYGIPFLCGRADVAAEALPGESTELAARRLRYAFLREAAPDGRIATAHTADDNLETVLLRLIRGTSPRGLGGIPTKQGRIIRPILFATRTQVMEYLAAEGIAFRTDETNDEDFCLRNRIRHHVVPLLRQENPNVAGRVLSLSRTARAEDAYLSMLAEQALDGAQIPGGWSCRAINALPEVLRRRALFAILQRSGVPEPAERHMDLLDALVSTRDPSAGGSFPGLRLERRYDLLRVKQDVPEPLSPTPVSIPGVTCVPGYRIVCSAPVTAEAEQNGPDTFALNYDLIRPGLTVRARQIGDRLRLPGGSRSLKRLMIDKKIPASDRDAIPVLAVKDGIAAVAGLGADEGFLARCGNTAVVIQIEKEE